MFHILDARNQEKALVIKGTPSEELGGFKGTGGAFQRCPVAEFAPDQKAELQRILNLLLAPFRKSDQDEAIQVSTPWVVSTNATSPSTRKATLATMASMTTGASKARPSSGISAAGPTSMCG